MTILKSPTTTLTASPGGSRDQKGPDHVAIIMDGNGRWAERRGMPRSVGHKNGVDAVERAIEGAVEAGVSYMTLYAFSSENWSRPPDEVTALMGLLRLYLKKEVKRFHKEGIKLRVIGRRYMLADDINRLIDEAEALTKDNNKLTLLMALSYGGRDEILDATKAIATAVVEGRESLEDINEARFEQALSTHNVPDPDLVIRTSGEKRISNFLLWQMAYSEFCFLDVLWPDFTKDHFHAALEDFYGRSRRFGGRP